MTYYVTFATYYVTCKITDVELGRGSGRGYLHLVLGISLGLQAQLPSITKVIVVEAMALDVALPVTKFTWKAMGSYQQNRVRLIERRGACFHSISDRPAKPDGYPSYGILGTRYNSPSPRAGGPASATKVSI